MLETIVASIGRVGEVGTSTSNALARLLTGTAAFVVYLVLSLWFFPPLPDFRSAYAGYQDPLIFIWALHWWPWAVAHGMNPFLTKFIWYPQEVNLAWVTSVPAVAFLMLPVTLLWNAVVSYNVVALLAPVLAAWTAYRLTSDITHDFGASLVGGYIFGFSTYEVAQLCGGHMQLFLVFIPPLLVLLALQRLRNGLSRTKFIAAAAALLLLQIGVSTEVLATTTIFGALTWLVFVPFVDADSRRRLWRLACESVVAMAIMAVLAAPFLYYVAFGPRSFPDFLAPLEQFSIDLLNFAIPTPVTRLGRTVFGSIAARFPANYSESSGYLGLPLIVALAASFQSPSRYRLPLGILALLFAIVCLGPSLWVNGVQTGIWLPWRIAADLPILRYAFPTRFTMFLFLVVAVLLARWLAERRSASVRAARYALVLLGCVFLRPAPIPWSHLPTNPFFAPKAIARELPPADNVIVLPFFNKGPGLIWQMQSGMYFTETGGYVGPPPAAFAPYAGVIDALIQGRPGPTFAGDFTAFVATNHVRDVLVGPGTPQRLLEALSAFGWPERTVGDIRIIHVPPGTTPR